MLELNTRDFSNLIWIAIVLAGLLAWPKTRLPILGIFKAFFVWQIQIPVILAAIWTVAGIWLLSEFDVWTPRNLKTCLLWFVTTAVVGMFNESAIRNGTVTLAQLARGTVAAGAFVTFLSGINTLPFWAEFLLLPVLTLIVILVEVAKRDPRHGCFVTAGSLVLIVAGLGVLGSSLAQTVLEWNKFEPSHQAREFLIPITLTILFLPFLYLFMLVMAHERAAIQLSFRVTNAKLRREILWRGRIRFGLSLPLFRRYMDGIRLADIESSTDIKAVIAELSRSRRRERVRPDVDPAVGWSPDIVGSYLPGEGLQTKPYHRLAQNWWGDSPLLKIGGGFVEDELRYRIGGTEQAATQLRLSLHVNTMEAPDAADRRFYEVADQLVIQALGDETARRFRVAIQQSEKAKLHAGRVLVELKRDDWEAGNRRGYARHLTIQHPAHHERYPGIE